MVELSGKNAKAHKTHSTTIAVSLMRCFQRNQNMEGLHSRWRRRNPHRGPARGLLHSLQGLDAVDEDAVGAAEHAGCVAAHRKARAEKFSDVIRARDLDVRGQAEFDLLALRAHREIGA